MLKVTVRNDGNEFTVEGEVTWPDVQSVLDKWFALQVCHADIDARLSGLTTRLQTGAQALGGAVDAAGA